LRRFQGVDTGQGWVWAECGQRLVDTVWAKHPDGYVCMLGLAGVGVGLGVGVGIIRDAKELGLGLGWGGHWKQVWTEADTVMKLLSLMVRCMQ
jgi:hypothetical protein